MRTVETLTWLLMLGVVLNYTAERKMKQIAKPVAVSISAQREVDPTRWRHDGLQPADWGSFRGNAERMDDPEVLALRNALAF